MLQFNYLLYMHNNLYHSLNGIFRGVGECELPLKCRIIKYHSLYTQTITYVYKIFIQQKKAK